MLRYLAICIFIFAFAGTSLAEHRNGHLQTADRIYKKPEFNASRQADEWRESRPRDSALMEILSSVPTAVWLGDFSGDVGQVTREHLNRSTQQDALPIFVIYNIPNRDAGLYSAGGESSAGAYSRFIERVATAIGATPAVVILEPDALAQMHLYSIREQKERYAILRDAVDQLTWSGSVDLYLDAGNSAWIDAHEMSTRLERAHIHKARGFSLNVSNFQWTEDSLAYGRYLSRLVGDKHFVIDTSRNGNGPLTREFDDLEDLEWCNPPGRAIGEFPAKATGDPLCDAYLWIKPPGESDGECRGGPPPGHWHAKHALELMRNAERARDFW